MLPLLPVQGRPPGGAAGLLTLDRTSPQLVEPDLAASPYQRTGGGGTYAGWTQVTAGLGYDFLCMGIYLYTMVAITVGGLVFSTMRVQLATGGAGSETLRAACATRLAGSNPAGNTYDVLAVALREMPFQPFVVPQSTRIAFRSCVDTVAASYSAIYLYGFDNGSFLETPDAIDHDDYWGGDLAATQGTVITPDAAATTLTAGASAWTYGSWVQFVASAPADLLIRGVMSGAATGVRTAIVQIGIGASGSEVGYDRIGYSNALVFPGPGPGYARLARPFRVESGERVALRMASSTGSFQMGAILAYEQLL